MFPSSSIHNNIFYKKFPEGSRKFSIYRTTTDLNTYFNVNAEIYKEIITIERINMKIH